RVDRHVPGPGRGQPEGMGRTPLTIAGRTHASPHVDASFDPGNTHVAGGVHSEICPHDTAVLGREWCDDTRGTERLGSGAVLPETTLWRVEPFSMAPKEHSVPGCVYP